MNGVDVRSLFLIVVLFVLSGCETTEQGAQNAQGLTPDHFQRTAIIENDDRKDTATITTIDGYRRKQGLLRFVYDDNFLRAIIDKKTEKVTYQLYQSIFYQASDWRMYRKANYESPEGPQSVDASFLRPPLAHHFDCPDHTSSICTYNEHVGFSVGRELLDSIASTYEPSKNGTWRFTFTPRIGDDFQDELSVAEIVGFLQAVDYFKSVEGI